LSSQEIEIITSVALPSLGDSDEQVSKAVREAVTQIATSRQDNSQEAIRQLNQTVASALTKIQEIAEKIQTNTSRMIVDGQFLTQESVAEMVMSLCDEKISKLINGRIIPNDRVFYPVKPIVGTVVEGTSKTDLKDKVVLITTSSAEKKDIERVKQIARRCQDAGTKQVIILNNNKQDIAEFKDFHNHAINMMDEQSIRRIFNTAKSKFGGIDVIIHFTGDYDYNKSFISMSREQWDNLIGNFIHIPSLITKEGVNAMAPPEAIVEPAKYKGSKGIIIIVGPDAPSGKKISGLLRSRSDVFRGALRPYTATVNQELSDVLGSNIKVCLILAGNIAGSEPNLENLYNSVLNLASGSSLRTNEAIFYVDETR
jgi:NAD(P)-dependent dehydrogenase (short-subunit alcohol dehydrogenase family)